MEIINKRRNMISKDNFLKLERKFIIITNYDTYMLIRNKHNCTFTFMLASIETGMNLKEGTLEEIYEAITDDYEETIQDVVSADKVKIVLEK